MPLYPFSPSQRAQLMGWLNNEIDMYRCLRAVAAAVMLPRVLGTADLIDRDHEFLNRVRWSIRSLKDSPDTPVELLTDDAENLLEVASKNTYADKTEFWNSVARTIKESEGTAP